MSLPNPAISCAGMPPLNPDAQPLSHFEFWPSWAFYAPVWAWVAVLAVRYRGIRLPLLANPGFPAGGLVGEEKSRTFLQLRGSAGNLVPKWIAVRKGGRCVESQIAAVSAALARSGIDFPLVAKPDIGCRGAGVRPIADSKDLRRYLSDFPDRETVILQQMVVSIGEAGVFYVREPGARHGRIISLTLKYFPHVVGDGRRTLRELIDADPRAGRIAEIYLNRFAGELDEIVAAGQSKRLIFSGSHSKGAIFKNGNAWITESMRARFDKIADSIEGFHFGRFDIRFADFEAFRAGRDFAIIEINGAGAESTHIWDSETRLFEAWRALFVQFGLLFKIGAANRARRFRPESWRLFLRRWLRERRLRDRYPSTE
ncbi:MAG TPA: hypothetical protein VGN36_05775 [Sphingorhabdus sp.]|jgi:hypothetical protein|nr:hypothetical protein [Sphingorhabdus sp.]